MPLLDDAFAALQAGIDLEERGDKTEAATKYYTAVYLMQRCRQSLPIHKYEERQLLEEKINHYNKLASELMNGQTIVTPRSPIESRCFFTEDTSVMPILPPPAATTTTSPRFAGSNSHQVSSPEHSSLVSRITEKAGRANTRLAHALDLDETGDGKKAIAEYMSAAAIYLEAIQLAEVGELQTIMPLLKGRAKAALDRVDQLKRPNDISREQSSVPVEPSEQRTRNLSLALSDEEVKVLRKSSLISSGVFLPWSDDEAQVLSREAGSAMTPLYVDPNGMLKMNDKQRSRFYKFARPSEICKLTKFKVSMVKVVTPYSIRQQFVTDCSFIASLCICSAFERRFRKRLVTSIIYPQNGDGWPVYNPSGKYMVKLWLNGVARQVVVDDYLPIDKYGNLLCSQTTTSSSLELWVSIVEKAYMKLCGGWDFPGSNSGVDLFSLTGWIPERIFFPKDASQVRDFETPTERAWERLYGANSYGDCLITVSTSNDLSDEDADSLGLVTGHAYAVLAVIKTQDKSRLLQLKNPWAHKSWRGKYSSVDQLAWRDPSFCKEVGYDPKLAAKHDDGVFWIAWDDVLRYFQNLHLSWNPALFPYRTSTHACWPKNQGPAVDTFNVGENPQYIVVFSDAAVTRNPTIWILLSRHVTKQEQEGAEATDFLTVHIHRSPSAIHRVWYPSSKTTVLSGAYTNNPHVLARYDVTGPKDKYLSLVLSQHEKSKDVSFTLSCFSTENFSISRPAKDPHFSIRLNGAWDPRTAGGPPGWKSFGNNPMWSVRVPKDNTLIQLRVSTLRTFAVNVMLVAVDRPQTRVSRLTGKPEIDSGSYRHGFAVVQGNRVPAGDYVLIVSTFEAQQFGAFVIQLFSSIPVQTEPLHES